MRRAILIGTLAALLESLGAAGSAAAATVFDDYFNLAGYELYKAGSAADTVSFKVPSVSCPSTDASGIAPGTFGMVSSRFGATEYLYGAELKYSCENGVLTTQEGLLVSGQETDFSHPVA